MQPGSWLSQGQEQAVVGSMEAQTWRPITTSTRPLTKALSRIISGSQLRTMVVEAILSLIQFHRTLEALALLKDT